MNEMLSKTTFAAFLATILTIGFLGLIAALFMFKVEQENTQLLTAAAGVLFTGSTMSWGFYFGSSTGSKTKDAAMIEASKVQEEKQP